jgi:excisionase family DNA binding protein
METRQQQPEYMNAQGLATHLGVTERTVRRWIERGEIAAEKRGRSFARGLGSLA